MSGCGVHRATDYNENGRCVRCGQKKPRKRAHHECDDPIRCSTCLAEKAVKATARRAAARKGAAKR